jgi:hypothetical protein
MQFEKEDSEVSQSQLGRCGQFSKIGNGRKAP